MRAAVNPLRIVALAFAALAASASALSLADAALVGAGVSAAGASAAFAGFMVAQGGRERRINGLEYLAIFAQPNGAAKRGASEAPPLAEPARLSARLEIDREPTGSIAATSGAAPALDNGFHLVAGQRDFVWMRHGPTIRAVRPGNVVAGLGTVGAIIQRGGRWVVLDTAGAVLLGDDADGEAKKGPSARRLAKSLIFD